MCVVTKICCVNLAKSPTSLGGSMLCVSTVFYTSYIVLSVFAPLIYVFPQLLLADYNYFLA